MLQDQTYFTRLHSTPTATKSEITHIDKSVLHCSYIVLFCSWFRTAFFGAMHLQRNTQMSKHTYNLSVSLFFCSNSIQYKTHAYKLWTSNKQLKITSGTSVSPKCETGSQNCKCKGATNIHKQKRGHGKDRKNI